MVLAEEVGEVEEPEGVGSIRNLDINYFPCTSQLLFLRLFYLLVVSAFKTDLHKFEFNEKTVSHNLLHLQFIDGYGAKKLFRLPANG